ncbi:MAG: hypothetical protein IIY78_07985 [Clostridia bacterium]|nr:hypothetical protein [Clostridia bacterium]
MKKIISLMLSALLPQRRLHLRIMMKPRGVILNADIQKYETIPNIV